MIVHSPPDRGERFVITMQQHTKQLRFFDTLALYFNCEPDSARRSTSFEHVPKDESHDATVTIDRIAQDTYALNPYPFDTDDLVLDFCGRWLTPVDSDDALRLSFKETDPETQSVRLVAKRGKSPGSFSPL